MTSHPNNKRSLCAEGVLFSLAFKLVPFLVRARKAKKQITEEKTNATTSADDALVAGVADKRNDRVIFNCIQPSRIMEISMSNSKLTPSRRAAAIRCSFHFYFVPLPSNSHLECKRCVRTGRAWNGKMKMKPNTARRTAIKTARINLIA